jgi:stress-induced morphogen
MTSKQAKVLVRALEEKFGGEGDFELVNKKGRYRFAIVSKKFEKMSQLKRQDEIWKIVDRVLPRDAVLDVSIVLAFDPADLVPAGE